MTTIDITTAISSALWRDGDQYMSEGFGIRTRRTDPASGPAWYENGADGTIGTGRSQWHGDPDLNAQGTVGMPNTDGTPNGLTAVTVQGKPWDVFLADFSWKALAEFNGGTDPAEEASDAREMIAELRETVAQLERDAATNAERMRYATERIANMTNAIGDWEADAEKVAEALREEAIRRDWCSEYGEFVERVNRRTARFELLPCSRDYVVSFTVNVRLTAATADAASEMAEGEMSAVLQRHLAYSVVDMSCDDVSTDD